ncbi:MAG: DUF4348 domain-containing protein [Bacteroidaceae bacterium]|nr:DUF4348 domain-containing protein [Bacteroidaceae bacterium]
MKWKWFQWIILSGLLSAACSQPKNDSQTDTSTESESYEETLEDSLLSQADTLLLDQDLADEPLQEISPENFDDFLFLFDNSNRYQRHHVQFPLKVTDADGTTHTLARRDWKPRSMSLGQDFCTVLWNGRSQMSLAQDSIQQRAVVQHIYLHSRIVENFQFLRDSIDGQWTLSSVRSTSFDHLPQRTFLDFYRDFATDSVFQRHHIQSPLRFTIASEDAEDRVEGTIDIDQWFEFAPELPKAVLVNIDYGQRFPNPNRMILQMRGFSDGMQNLFVFQKETAGRWRLTEFEN